MLELVVIPAVVLITSIVSARARSAAARAGAGVARARVGSPGARCHEVRLVGVRHRAGTGEVRGIFRFDRRQRRGGEDSRVDVGEVISGLSPKRLILADARRDGGRRRCDHGREIRVGGSGVDPFRCAGGGCGVGELDVVVVVGGCGVVAGDYLAGAGGEEDVDDGDIGVVLVDCGVDGEGCGGGVGGFHGDDAGVGWAEVDARGVGADVGVVTVGGHLVLVI